MHYFQIIINGFKKAHFYEIQTTIRHLLLLERTMQGVFVMLRKLILRVVVIFGFNIISLQFQINSWTQQNKF